jgi:DNA repair photolyase
VADIGEIEKTIKKIPKGTVVRMGVMSDCFMPLERTERVALETIKLLNAQRIEYLIVTKGADLISDDEYIAAMDKDLSHIQISISSTDDDIAMLYENAPPVSERVKAIIKLQDAGFDVAMRLSPFIDELTDFQVLNSWGIEKTLIEFLRVNSKMKNWFPYIDYARYTLNHGGYLHLPLHEKRRLLDKIALPNISIGEHVPAHHEFFRKYLNPNKNDCCNLRCSTAKMN